MAYDQQLAQRLRDLIGAKKGFKQRQTFWGLGFLLHGQMCFGVYKKNLVLNLGEEQAKKALLKKEARRFDITGQPVKGWVMITPEGTKSEGWLKQWTTYAMNFVLQPLEEKK